MVKIKIVQVDDDLPDERKLKKISEMDPDEPLMAGGQPSGLTPRSMKRIIDAMPKEMNEFGFVLLMVNAMAVYNLLPRSDKIILNVLAAIAALAQDHPALIEKDGYKKAVAMAQAERTTKQ